jgi:hypothetical protein
MAHASLIFVGKVDTLMAHLSLIFVDEVRHFKDLSQWWLRLEISKVLS